MAVLVTRQLWHLLDNHRSFISQVVSNHCFYFRPPAVSDTYHKKTVYVVAWGPNCYASDNGELLDIYWCVTAVLSLAIGVSRVVCWRTGMLWNVWINLSIIEQNSFLLGVDVEKHILPLPVWRTSFASIVKLPYFSWRSLSYRMFDHGWYLQQ